MKSKFLLLTALWWPGLLAAVQTSFELVPKGRPTRLAIADPREIGMGLQFGAGNRIEARVGNYFSLLEVSQEESWKWHLGIEGGGFFSLRQEGSKFPLEHTDGLVGLYIEGANKPWEMQLRFTHISAHLADGSLGNTSIIYSREFISARVGYTHEAIWHAYAGVLRNTNAAQPVGPWALQVGGSFFPPWRLSKISPFAAVDLKWKQESAYRTCVNLQVGVALNQPHEPYHSFRLFYNFYSGADPRGQFFLQQKTAHSLGIEMQI